MKSLTDIIQNLFYSISFLFVCPSSFIFERNFVDDLFSISTVAISTTIASVITAIVRDKFFKKKD